VSAIAIVNGKLLDPDVPAVSVFDAAVLHGDAYFETLRTYNGRPALLGAHLARLTAAVEQAGFPDPPSIGDLADEVAAAVNEFSEGELSIRVMVSRGQRDLGLTTEPARATRIVTARLIDESPAGRDAAVSVADVPGYTYPHKSANYQRQSELLRGARGAGIDDVLISDAGELIEGATSNVFVICGDELATPALGRCLPGVTRGAVLGLADAAGLRAVERGVSVDELRAADEIFLTNSLIELRRVDSIDGRRVGGRAREAVAAIRSALLATYLETA
jgi:branched-subunit amino acid aminotransferase/4-amino-4-deoxychorismate lyase